MLKNTFFFLCLMLSFHSKAQVAFRKMTIEPAIGTRLWSLSGALNLQASTILQYNVNQRFSGVSYTIFDIDVKKFSAFEDIQPKYSFTIIQRAGAGVSLHTKRTTNTFSILGGVKYFTYSGSINNPKLEEKITTKRSFWTTDFGAMYQLKIGRKKRFFTSRIYLPLQYGKWGILETGSIEFGVGFTLSPKIN